MRFRMPTSPLPWDDLQLVLAIERARTLSAAARALACNQSTVTRRLAALHDRLGERVLERRGGAYVLTHFGEGLRPYLHAMEDGAQAIERAAHGVGSGASGPVRLTTVETLATFFFAPRLGALRAAHPRLVLELDVSRRSADLSRREADVALRLARPRQAGLVARKIGVLGVGLYVATSRKRGPYPIVGGDESDGWSPEAKMLAAHGGSITMRSPSWLTQLHAVEAGVGIGALPCFLADARPLLRRLGTVIAHRELWLLVHRDLQMVARVRAVLDFVATQVRRHADELAGQGDDFVMRA
jgi:DNA-binding transcriptional LysR family regulator